MANSRTRRDEELRGGYAESELVEDLLSQGEEWNYLKFQQAQNAVTDQRWAANAAQMFTSVLLGKAAVQFPKAVVADVVTESESISKTVNDDTASTLTESMADNFSKDFDSMKSSVADMQAQMTDVIATQSMVTDLMATMKAILARIEIEAE